MITVKLHGGLGNQMFQYACGRALSLRSNTELRIDPGPLYDITPRKNFVFRKYSLSTVFSIDPIWNIFAKRQRSIKIPYADTVFNKLYPMILGMFGYWRYVREKQSIFDPNFAHLSGNVYLDGYWQTEKYFKDQASILKMDFTFRNVLDGDGAVLAKDIMSCASVMLNVRRGDYVHNAVSSKLHKVMTPDFYTRAIALMKEKIGENIKVFIFSDEIDWCRENLVIDADHVFVGHKYAGQEFRDYLQLMSLCKHFIIPNSTFAWWAAWLSNYRDKVIIAPKQWFHDTSINTRDVVPEEWIRI